MPDPEDVDEEPDLEGVELAFDLPAAEAEAFAGVLTEKATDFEGDAEAEEAPDLEGVDDVEAPDLEGVAVLCDGCET